MDRHEPTSPNLDQLSALLARDRPAGTVLQDYCPAFDCIDWQLSRRFWDQRGPQAFFDGDVPYVVTNDGYLAGNAVAVLLASAQVAADNGTLEDEIKVMELGAGSGLFAKQFLDQLAASDHDIAATVYDRLTYVVTDGSDAMIAAIESRGILADHADHVTCLPARLPGLADALGAHTMTGQFRAVFANYLLDSLPFTILSLQGDKVHELRLRTAVADGIDLSQYTTLDEAEITARLQNDEIEDLTGLYAALVIDGRYDPVDRHALPLPDAIPDGPADAPCPYLHCHGALACIGEVTHLLRPDGFMLATDYGLADPDPAREAFEFQHFGGSVAIGLNFEAVSRVFDGRDGIQVVAPDSDTDHLLSRLIGPAPAPAVTKVFRDRYSKATWDRLTQPLKDAQDMVSHGQIEAARWKYDEALRLQPHNWAVLEEIAGFLTYHLEDYDAGLAMGRAALELNHMSPGAWNIVGDCFFYSDHLNEAAQAYEKASQSSPQDVRCLLNMAWVATRADRPAQALEFIAKGLALDTDGTFREALLDKQRQVLDRQAAKHQADTLRGFNRIRSHRNLPGRTPI